jgi:hypothetical protein
MGGGYSDGVKSAIDESFDMREELVFIDSSIRFPWGTDSSPAKESELGISGGLGLKGPLL